MIAVRYGCVPIVRRTGGLGDTISEFDPVKGCGNGFVFEQYDAKSLLMAVNRALDSFENAENRQKVIANAMKSDFSTRRCAKQYESLYSEAVNRRNEQALAA